MYIATPEKEETNQNNKAACVHALATRRTRLHVRVVRRVRMDGCACVCACARVHLCWGVRGRVCVLACARLPAYARMSAYARCVYV